MGVGISLQRDRSTGFRAVAAFLLVQLLLAWVLAAAPALHHLVHDDCDHEDHECIVTHLLHGDISDGLPAPLIQPAPVAVAIGQAASLKPGVPFLSPLFLDDGVLVHGPPVLGC